MEEGSCTAENLVHEGIYPRCGCADANLVKPLYGANARQSLLGSPSSASLDRQASTPAALDTGFGIYLRSSSGFGTGVTLGHTEL